MELVIVVYILFFLIINRYLFTRIKKDAFKAADHYGYKLPLMTLIFNDTRKKKITTFKSLLFDNLVGKQLNK